MMVILIQQQKVLQEMTEMLDLLDKLETKAQQVLMEQAQILVKKGNQEIQANLEYLELLVQQAIQAMHRLFLQQHIQHLQHKIFLAA